MPDMWHGLSVDTTIDFGPNTAEILEGVVVEQPCHEYWEWDEFSAWCELKIDGHTKHRWTHHDDYKGVDVVIEWESYWGELPDTAWLCPDCNHLHKGKDENAENPRYWGNGGCKEKVPHWSGQLADCTCPRRRPNKKENQDAEQDESSL